MKNVAQRELAESGMPQRSSGLDTTVSKRQRMVSHVLSHSVAGTLVAQRYRWHHRHARTLKKFFFMFPSPPEP